MPNITIKLDPKKDVWNWWEACNKVSHGVDWKMSIDSNLRDKIVGKTQDEAFSFLVPYINKIYLEKNLELKAQILQKEFEEREFEIFDTMQKLTKRKIYREDFICFFTTFPRFAYEYENGFVWISYKRDIDFQVSIFIHELLHFQFFAYYGEKAWDILGPEKYQVLKEGMTIILDEEFSHVTSVKDEGYEIHELVRKEFLETWKKLKDFELFFEEAIKILQQT